MKNQENPPQNIEKGSNTEQVQEHIKFEEEYKEVASLSKSEEEEKIKKLYEQLLGAEQKEIVQNTDTNKEKEFLVPIQKKKMGWLKKGLLALGFLAATSAGAQSTKEAEKNVSKKETTKSTGVTQAERATSTSATYKMGLEFYKGGKTREGSITPTGQSNSFENNMYNITEDDAYDIAEKYGFRTTNSKDFQTDLLDYTNQHHPELIKDVLKKFGETNAGTLYDGILGARTMYLLKVYKEKNPSPEFAPEPVQEVDPIPEIDTLPSLETPPPSLETFDELYIYFDLSPSMKANQKSLAEELRTLQRNKPVTIIGFTDEADTTFSVQGTTEAADTLESIDLIDKNSELAIDVLLNTLPKKQFNKESKNVILVSTDESLQKVTKEKLISLEKLGVEKGLTFQFRMMVRGKVKDFSLPQIKTMYEDAYGNHLPTANVNITGYENEFNH